MKSVIYSEKTVFYRKVGTGNPVILIHGFGEDGRVWEPLAESLKNDFCFIIPDLPGSGQSELISDVSMEELAEVIHAIIHQESIQACPVIGHSMGGYITLALAEKYWNHVSAIGLFHSTAKADSEEKKINRKKGIEFIKQHGAFAFLKTVIPNLFSPVFREEKYELIQTFMNQQLNFTADALISYYDAMMKRPDRTDLLRHTKAPVLFVVGIYDTVVSPADAEDQARLPEKSYIYHLQNSGHMGMLEEPEEAKRIIKEFLEKNDRRS
ncbi:MAG: alpha/beta hydrolase [Chitinophagaceae bacterium]|nr:alpha/beta hydrolase [Chitinophagaceae bacterium]